MASVVLVTERPQRREAATTDAYGPRPVLRGRFHQLGFILAMPAGLFLLAAAHTTAARVAVAIYWATLAGQFGASASYHRFAHTERSVMWLRRLDHSMIFMLIAGTYTPICLLVLPRAWGIPILVAAWVTALAGIILKMISVRATGSTGGSWLYIVLGWGAVITLPQLLSHLGLVRGALLGIGGVLYTGGAVILGRRRPDPLPTVFGYHEVWHVITLIACACHFAVIAMILAS